MSGDDPWRGGMEDMLRALTDANRVKQTARIDAALAGFDNDRTVDVFGAVEGVGQAMVIPIVAPPCPTLAPARKPNRAERRETARKARR